MIVIYESKIIISHGWKREKKKKNEIPDTGKT